MNKVTPIRAMRRKATENRNGLSTWPVIIMYVTLFLSEAWHFFFKLKEIGFKDARSWFISPTYRIPENQIMDCYMWVKCFSEEIAFLLFSIMHLVAIIKIENIYSKLGYPKLNVLGYYKVFAIGLVSFCFLDLGFWLWNYKTSPQFFLVHAITEAAIVTTGTVLTWVNNKRQRIN